MRTLLLLRHAKSDRTQQVSEDFERPLNERGRDAATRVGHWMKHHHLRPEWVICSPAARTRETLAIMRTHLPIPDTLIDFDDRVYLADVQTLLAVLARCPQDMNNILMIGHNPGLEELLVYLCGEQLPLSAKGKLMPTATLAQIAMPDDWRGLAAKSGKMMHLVRPDELA
jgi:phosphohistidine phosphatase